MNTTINNFRSRHALWVAEMIQKHGHTIISVGSGKCDVPGCRCGPAPVTWSYTIGLVEDNLPELVAFGLCSDGPRISCSIGPHGELGATTAASSPAGSSSSATSRSDSTRFRPSGRSTRTRIRSLAGGHTIRSVGSPFRHLGSSSASGPTKTGSSPTIPPAIRPSSPHSPSGVDCSPTGRADAPTVLSAGPLDVAAGGEHSASYMVSLNV